MSRSARPGRSSGSSSGCCLKRSSTHAWNRVPNRAARRRLARHRPGQLAGERVGVVLQAQQRGRRQAAGQRDHDLGAALGPGLDEQPLDLGVPVSDPGALDHVEIVVLGIGVRGPHQRGRFDPQERLGAGARGRPGPRRVLVGVGVGVALRGLVVPLRLRLSPGREQLADDALVLGRAERRGPRAPAVRRDRQLVGGAREGDVPQAELLGAVVRTGVGAVGRERGAVVAPELGQVLGVTAQGRGDHGGRRRPQRPGAIGREARVAHSDQEHRTPLEPLDRCTVSSLTESAAVGVAMSRPLPWSSSAVR